MALLRFVFANLNKIPSRYAFSLATFHLELKSCDYYDILNSLVMINPFCELTGKLTGQINQQQGLAVPA